VVRDGGCVADGCDRPPRWTEAHHKVHWADGGPTSLDNLVLLCRRHHRMAHGQGPATKLAQGP
jgi:5-methylcytosine-specific restriction endonuclease McrA